jgi:hypothetical protein
LPAGIDRYGGEQFRTIMKRYRTVRIWRTCAPAGASPFGAVWTTIYQVPVISDLS